LQNQIFNFHIEDESIPPVPNRTTIHAEREENNLQNFFPLLDKTLADATLIDRHRQRKLSGKHPQGKNHFQYKA
jgi:hypothetical protein